MPLCHGKYAVSTWHKINGVTTNTEAMQWLLKNSSGSDAS